MRPLFWSLVLSLIWLSFVHAEEERNTDSYEAKAVGAFLKYCLPTLIAQDSVARVAEMQKLPRLKAEPEKAFLQGKSGKVFGIPEVGGGIVLSAPAKPMCSVIVQRLDAREFIRQLDYWFDPAHTPFALDKDNTQKPGEHHREYKARFNDVNIRLIASVRMEPLKGAAQAMLTAGRIE